MHIPLQDLVHPFDLLFQAVTQDLVVRLRLECLDEGGVGLEDWYPSTSLLSRLLRFSSCGLSL